MDTHSYIMTLKCNNHTRPLVPMSELDKDAQKNFGYVTEDEFFDSRFFEYRGEWYDANEFTTATDDVKALGFDGMQGQSYFSAVVVRFFDKSGEPFVDEIVVGYLRW